MEEMQRIEEQAWLKFCKEKGEDKQTKGKEQVEKEEELNRRRSSEREIDGTMEGEERSERDG